ncbi:MAG: bifunctional UDP-N-acetylglucosamine diphosphorylase/glucosamine-1-phosphate N-acetyltransferase GlmU [Steroidobacteraceae bacterium]
MRTAASTHSTGLSVVILAAGEGKRMNSRLPKVLQPLAGRPLLAHVLDTAHRLSPQRILVVYGHAGEQVRAAFPGESVQWVPQERQLGTGHAVQQAVPHVPDGDTVLVLYGDVPLLGAEPLARLVRIGAAGELALLTMVPEDPAGYGRIVRDASGRVARNVEQKDATPGELAVRECNTGVLAAPAHRLKDWLAQLRNDNAQGEYYLTDVIGLAVAQGATVTAVSLADSIDALGVNDKTQLAQLEAVCRRRAAQALMTAGVTVVDPARIDVRGSVTHGQDVFVDVNVVFEGRVKLGNRVRIGSSCVIRDSEVGDDTELFPFCVLDGAVIGAAARIGPFSRVRPTTALGPGVHIGNFVEVKNSTLGTDSKANHLSYVGDAQVGARVNIGAGTIVANYDGANKHRTIIHDDAHTGSNSVLVAPITVGEGATIAAGSTVVHEVPAGRLTIARARQSTLEDWQRPVKKPK